MTVKQEAYPGRSGRRLGWPFGRRATKLALASMTAVAFSITALSPQAFAQAAPPPNGVQAGHNITVFHELDIVAASGHEVGDELTIQVIRNGVVIGTTSGPAVNGPEGVGLEVNHEGTGADDGSCWTGVTPDILPGDRVVVEGPDGVDATTVLDVSILEGPFEATAEDAAADPELQAGDIVLTGTAADAEGNPLPLAELGMGVRDRSVDDFRASPSSFDYTEGTSWRAIYRAPYQVGRNDGNLTQAEQKQAILNPTVGHELAWESPDLTVAMISEGPGEGGPAVGCNAPKSAFGVTSFDDRAVNIASEDLVAGGTVMNDANVTTESARISLTDSAGEAITRDATIDGTTWTATFPRADIETLAEGTLTASGVYTIADGTELTGATKQLQKDTVAPDSATATPPAGIYNSVQSVSLNGEGGADIRYTLNGSEPGANSNLYNGQLQISSSQQIKARVFDSAGNSSEAATFDYTIDRVAPGLSASLNSGIFDSPQSLELVSNDESAKIYYTTNGDVPEESDQLYSGPIEISRSQLVKAVAVDEAGNRSRVLERDIVIEAPSALTLNTGASIVTFGKATVLSGRLAADGEPLAGKRVMIQHRPVGANSFTRVPGQPAAGVLVEPDGRYRLAGVKPQKNTLYRASFAGAAEIKQSLSAAKRVNVRSVVANATSAKQIKLGQSKVIGGRVKPAHAGRVKVEIKRGNQLVLTRNVKLTNSRYRLVYKPRTSGNYTVRVTMPKHADHLEGVSPAKKFRVTR